MATEDILLATLTTDENGEATYTYTGDGIGEVDFVAKWDSLESKICEIHDCTYYDPCNSDTASRYNVNTGVGNSIEYDSTNHCLILTVGSSNRYVAGDTNQSAFTLSDYLGETVIFSVNVNPSRSCALQIVQVVNGQNQITTSDYVAGKSTISISASIDENATRVQFRVLGNGSGSAVGDTIQIKDWEIYPFYDNTVSSINMTGDKSFIQTDETATLTITATDHEHLPVPNKTIKIYFNGVLKNTVTTDSNGEATYSFTGTGSGLNNITAKYGMVQSETYSIIDATYYDPCTSDTSSRYSVNTGVGNTLAYDNTNNCLVLTVSTANRYVAGDTNQSAFTLSDYTGKSVKFEVDVNPSRSCALQIVQVVNGQTQVTTSDYVNSQSTISIDADIDSTATKVQFRILGNGTGATSGDTITFKNWKIYSI